MPASDSLDYSYREEEGHLVVSVTDGADLLEAVHTDSGMPNPETLEEFRGGFRRDGHSGAGAMVAAIGQAVAVAFQLLAEGSLDRVYLNGHRIRPAPSKASRPPRSLGPMDGVLFDGIHLPLGAGMSGGVGGSIGQALAAVNVGRTGRGFHRADFKDLYKQECSIQKSSLARAEAIWLGVGRDLSGADVNARMHLSQEMAAALIPLLISFVRTGSLGALPLEGTK